MARVPALLDTIVEIGSKPENEKHRAHLKEIAWVLTQYVQLVDRVMHPCKRRTAEEKKAEETGVVADERFAAW